MCEWCFGCLKLYGRFGTGCRCGLLSVQVRVSLELRGRFGHRVVAGAVPAGAVPGLLDIVLVKGNTALFAPIFLSAYFDAQEIILASPSSMQRSGVLLFAASPLRGFCNGCFAFARWFLRMAIQLCSLTCMHTTSCLLSGHLLQANLFNMLCGMRLQGWCVACGGGLDSLPFFALAFVLLSWYGNHETQFKQPDAVLHILV